VTGGPLPAPVRSPIPARAGIGLRSQHHEAILETDSPPAWLEVHTENYFHAGGPAVRALERARSRYPLSLHGVGLGLGSADPIDRGHLERVRDAVQRFEPGLVSEHACWGHVDGQHFNDLLPLPYTEEAVEHLAARVRDVQDFLGRQILVENLSASEFASRSSAELPRFGAAAVACCSTSTTCVNAANLDSTSMVLRSTAGAPNSCPRPLGGRASC
jgi:hypothetical protein